MSPSQFLPIVFTATFLTVSGAFAQMNPDFKINKITPDFRESPAGDTSKRVQRAGKWLEVEVSFDWQPRLKPESPYLDDLTVNYYILLNNPNANKDRIPTLLTGTVTHVDVAIGRDLHSVVYISPRALERYFGGTAPASAPQAVFDIGVTLSSGGQVVAQSSLKGQPGWWTTATYKPIAGVVVNKNDSPFSSTAWDYYEPIKLKGAGL